MKKICLISDTHSYWREDIEKYIAEADEVWHAGDLGSVEIVEKLEKYNSRIVYGNIDNAEIRRMVPEEQIFIIENLKIYMIHIGGYPPKYTSKLKKRLDEVNPDLFICGHSHILRVIPDKSRTLLHMNPGACGKHGFHSVRTLLRFKIDKGEVKDLEAIELK